MHALVLALVLRFDDVFGGDTDSLMHAMVHLGKFIHWVVG